MPQANRLLGGLSCDELDRLSPHLRQTPLRSKQALLRQGEPVQQIIFPSRGVCSLVKTMEDGHSIEVMGVGAEGAVGAHVILGQAESATDVIVQVPDEAALSLPLDVFKSEIEERGTLCVSMTAYCSTLARQLMYASACNALHLAQQRCCRWLLTTDDRVHGGGFHFTHDMLAATLGVRRPTVTFILAELQRAGIVEYGRGALLKVLDRPALEAKACECYRALSPSLA